MTEAEVSRTFTRSTGRLVGLDIGGSKTHVVVTTAGGRTLEDFQLPGANLAAIGPQEVGRRLDSVMVRIGRERLAAVAVGAAGLDSPGHHNELRALVAARIPGVPTVVVRDSALLLAAAGLTSGIAVIAGTGSVVWGRADDGRTAQAGGWGYLLGDEGGGYVIARAGVRHTLAVYDSGAEPDELALAILRHCGDHDTPALLGHFYTEPDRRYWATASAVVARTADAGDPVAGSILDQAAAGLINAIVTVRSRLGGDLPVVLAGGVLRHQPALRRRVMARLPEGTQAQVLGPDPVSGALALARRLASSLEVT